MKKVLCLLLVLVMLLSLWACGKKDTAEPTAPPTQTPTENTQAATVAATEATQEPTAEVTEEPSAAPTDAPTVVPTEEVTAAATTKGTIATMPVATVAPTTKATTAPTTMPTAAPTTTATATATTAPTIAPTTKATTAPTTKATVPTAAPTTKATAAPTVAPTTKATTAPTTVPTAAPTTKATAAPTAAPTKPVTIPTAAHQCTYVTMDLPSAATKAVNAGIFSYGKYATSSFADYDTKICTECNKIDLNSTKFRYTQREAAQMMLKWVNDLRAEVYGTHAYDLVLDDYCQSVAETRANQLVTNYSHTGKKLDENIVDCLNLYNQFVAWKNSSGHYAAMIDKTYARFGYGYAAAGDNEFGATIGYGCQTFNWG